MNPNPPWVICLSLPVRHLYTATWVYKSAWKCRWFTVRPAGASLMVNIFFFFFSFFLLQGIFFLNLFWFVQLKIINYLINNSLILGQFVCAHSLRWCLVNHNYSLCLRWQTIQIFCNSKYRIGNMCVTFCVNNSSMIQLHVISEMIRIPKRLHAQWRIQGGRGTGREGGRDPPQISRSTLYTRGFYFNYRSIRTSGKKIIN